jgi:hypothetical protein
MDLLLHHTIVVWIIGWKLHLLITNVYNAAIYICNTSSFAKSEELVLWPAQVRGQLFQYHQF